MIMNTQDICTARVAGNSSNSISLNLSLEDLSIETCPRRIVEGNIIFSIKIIGEKEFKITDIKK